MSMIVVCRWLRSFVETSIPSALFLSFWYIFEEFHRLQEKSLEACEGV